MTYEQGRGGHVVVANPNGFSTAVSITAASGRAITVYTDTARSVSVSMPDTITTTKQYYLDRDDAYVISTKVNSVECGIVGTNATPITQYIGGDATEWVGVDRELAQGAGTAASSAPLLDRGNWTTSTVYAVNDTVTQSGQRYVCATAHTAGTFATDLAALKWVSVDAVQAAPAQELVNVVATSGATQTIPDPITAQSISRITLSANCTFTFPALAAGKSFTLVLVQDATGSRTVTWPGTVLWAGGTAPTLTTAASKRDVLSFLCADGSTWLGFISGQNF